MSNLNINQEGVDQRDPYLIFDFSAQNPEHPSFAAYKKERSKQKVQQLLTDRQILDSVKRLPRFHNDTLERLSDIERDNQINKIKFASIIVLLIVSLVINVMVFFGGVV